MGWSRSIEGHGLMSLSCHNVHQLQLAGHVWVANPDTMHMHCDMSKFICSMTGTGQSYVPGPRWGNMIKGQGHVDSVWSNLSEQHIECTVH